MSGGRRNFIRMSSGIFGWPLMPKRFHKCVRLIIAPYQAGSGKGKLPLNTIIKQAFDYISKIYLSSY